MSHEYFEEVAPRWDELRSTFYSETVREKALDLAGVRAEHVAVDVGAGTGFVTEGLLKRGLRVVAVEPSEAMRAQLQKKFCGAKLECLSGEAERLPVADASADHVFANMSLHHVERPRDAVRDMARVLKPGGSLVITDLDEHTFSVLAAEHHDRWLGFKRSDVERWFTEAGLESVSVRDAEESCCAGSSGPKLTILVAYGRKRGRPSIPEGPIVSLVYRVAPERRAELFAFLCGAFPYYERPGGIRMGLYESVDEPGLIFELVSYATEEDYAKDQERVEKDPECRAVLGEWRKLLAGPVEVRRMRPLSLEST